jgi:alcohol dehydrogenase class IV
MLITRVLTGDRVAHAVANMNACISEPNAGQGGGQNPISDIFSLQALKSTVKYLPRAVKDPDDFEAQSQMLLAATLAGVGFGNAGVHLCHEIG